MEYYFYIWKNVFLLNLADEKLRRVVNFIKEGMEIAVKFASKGALTIQKSILFLVLNKG